MEFNPNAMKISPMDERTASAPTEQIPIAFLTEDRTIKSPNDPVHPIQYRVNDSNPGSLAWQCSIDSLRVELYNNKTNLYVAGTFTPIPSGATAFFQGNPSIAFQGTNGKNLIGATKYINFEVTGRGSQTYSFGPIELFANFDSIDGVLISPQNTNAYS